MTISIKSITLSGWQTKTLGEVCEIYQPKTISIKEMVSDGRYLVYGANGVIGKYDKFNHEEPQLLITCRGATCGSVNVSLPKCWITGNAMVIRPKNALLDIKYLEYIFRGGIDISKAITGAAQPQITRTNLEPLEISFPESLLEQKRIVKILDEVFEKTTKAKENAEKNLQNAREIFESYLQSVFANPGEGWEEKMLEEIGETQTGTTPKTVDKENYGNHIPFITPADIDISGDGTIRYREEGLSEKGLENGRKMKINSILMVCIGASIGKVGFVDRDVSCNQQINSLTVKKGLCPKFFYYALSTKTFFEKVIRNSAQATLPIINKGKWEKLTVSYPPSEKEQQFIVAKLDALSAETKKLESIYQQKLADLEELKKSIFQKAFNGNL